MLLHPLRAFGIMIGSNHGLSVSETGRPISCHKGLRVVRAEFLRAPRRPGAANHQLDRVPLVLAPVSTASLAPSI
jgi:hypothetical protein